MDTDTTVYDTDTNRIVCASQIGHQCNPAAGADTTWDTGTQSHESDGRDGIFQSDGAAHVRRQVANDGRQHSDQNDGDDERHVTVRHVYCKSMRGINRWTSRFSDVIHVTEPEPDRQ